MTDITAPDARSTMLASASTIAAFVVESEGKLADTAKAWGHALFRAVYADGFNMDAMIGDSKMAAGWNGLAASDAGRKAKSRLEVYFSNARLVAENWQTFTDDDRNDILAGLSSIHYRAGQLRKAKADADKAAKKEAARVKAEQEAADAKAALHEPAPADDTTTVQANTLADVLALALAMLQAPDMEDGEVIEASEAVAAFVAAYDARIAAITALVQQAA